VRALKPLLGVLAAVSVGVVVGVVVLSRGDGDGTLDPRAFGAVGQRSIALATSIQPRTHLFGDAVTAQADLLVDPRQVEPGSVRVDARFDPYTRVGDVERAETRAGDLVRVRYRFQLACFASTCMPTGDKREIDLQSGRVYFALNGRDGRNLRTHELLRWPSFSVASRLGPFDVERARWRASTAAMPGATYRLEPGVLAALLLLGSLALLAAAGVLVTTAGPVRIRRARPTEVVPRAVSPLERALQLARSMSQNGASDDQRRALERVSRELLAVGEPTLAGRARRLAWSADRAELDEVERLAGDVRAARAEKETPE
jgi:hypothetical protein